MIRYAANHDFGDNSWRRIHKATDMPDFMRHEIPTWAKYRVVGYDSQGGRLGSPGHCYETLREALRVESISLARFRRPALATD